MNDSELWLRPAGDALRRGQKFERRSSGKEVGEAIHLHILQDEIEDAIGNLRKLEPVDEYERAFDHHSKKRRSGPNEHNLALKKLRKITQNSGNPLAYLQNIREPGVRVARSFLISALIQYAPWSWWKRLVPNRRSRRYLFDYLYGGTERRRLSRADWVNIHRIIALVVIPQLARIVANRPPVKAHRTTAILSLAEIYLKYAPPRASNKTNRSIEPIGLIAHHRDSPFVEFVHHCLGYVGREQDNDVDGISDEWQRCKAIINGDNARKQERRIGLWKDKDRK